MWIRWLCVVLFLEVWKTFDQFLWNLTKHSEVTGNQVCVQMKDHIFFWVGNNSKVKIHKQFFFRTTGSISTNLGTKYSCVMRNNVQIKEHSFLERETVIFCIYFNKNVKDEPFRISIVLVNLQNKYRRWKPKKHMHQQLTRRGS